MKSNIIVERFKSSEKTHGLQYLWMIGDGDSSIFYLCVLGYIPYYRLVQKVECSNHAIKCYCGALGKLAKGQCNFSERNGLTAGKIQNLSKA